MKLRWGIKEPDGSIEERNFEISFSDSDERAEKELKLVQEIVKGYVEMVWIGGEVQALVNEEAMYAPDMKPNCGFLGTIIFVRNESDEEGSWWGSLTDEDFKKLKAWEVNHANDVHPSDFPPQVLTGTAMDHYRKRLADERKRQQVEWDSF